jgi:PAS domain S-box-containing protein
MNTPSDSFGASLEDLRSTFPSKMYLGFDIIVGFGMILLVLFVMMFALYIDFNKMIQAKRWNFQTYEFIREIHHLGYLFNKMERGIRHYETTAEESALHLFYYAKSRFSEHLESLHLLSSSTSERLKSVKHLSNTYEKWIHINNKKIIILNKKSKEHHKKIQDFLYFLTTDQEPEQSFYQVLKQIEEHEWSTLKERAETAEQFQNLAQETLLIGAFFSMILALLLLTLLTRNMRKLVETNQQLRQEMQERRQAEEQIRQSQKLLQSTLDVLSPCIALLNYEGVILAVNARWKEFEEENPLLGQTCGVNYLELCKSLEGKLAPTAQKIANGLQKVSSKSQLYFYLEYVLELPKKNFYFAVRISAFKDKLVLSQENITERHQAEQLLRESEASLQDFFDNASDMIQSIQPEGRLLYVNRTWKEILGYPHPESLNFFEVIPPENRPEAHHLFTRALEGEILKDIELRLLSASGKELIVSGSLNCRFKKGKPLALRGIFRDITKLKEIERLKDEFIATINHELRTPLTSIQGVLDLLAGGVAGTLNAKGEQLVQIALKNSSLLRRLIHDLLDIEKLELGQLDFKIERHSLIPLIHTALESNQASAHATQISLCLKKESDVEYFVRVDPHRLIQVLSNLLSNAIKFSPPSRTVFVQVFSQESQVCIEVQDQGLGVPESFRPQLFKKFARADSAMNRRVGGTGLGLSISKAILERMGGTIGFRSSSPEEGAIFFIQLPLDPLSRKQEFI